MMRGGGVASYYKQAILFWATLVFFAPVFGCAPVTRQMTGDELKAYAPSMPAREVRILTINAWTGLDYKGLLKMGRYEDNTEARYGLLASGIRRLDPDIIAVQEANLLPEFANRLSSDLGYEVVYHVSNGGFRFGPAGFPVNLRQGEMILVKKPWALVDLGERQLSGRGFSTNWFCMQLGEIRKATLARAVVNGKTLYIYGVHLHAGPFNGPALDWALERLKHKVPADKVGEAVDGVKKDILRRRREVAALSEFIEETLPKGAPAILLGCFNTDTESRDLDPLTSDGFWVDSYRLVNPLMDHSSEGYTWDPEQNPNFRPAGPGKYCDMLCSYQESRTLRLDFIFVSRSIPMERITASRVVFKPVEGASPSDHYGVLTTLFW